MCPSLKGKLTSKGTLHGHLSVGKLAEDYEKLKNLPQINGVELKGNKTTEDLNIPTQVQSDWNQADDGEVDFIKNKPSIPAAQVNSDWNAVDGVAAILNKPSIPAAQVNSDWNASTGVAAILNKPTIPAAQVQSDWDQTDDGEVDFIKNKPTLLTRSDVIDDNSVTDKAWTAEKLISLLPTGTANGAVANFNTSLELPLVSERFAITAVQDLHGQSGAYVSGGQLWDETWELGAWSSATGGPVNYTDRIRCKSLIPVQESTAYCIRLGTTATCIVNAYDVNGDFIENLVNGTFGTSGRAFTTSANCKYVKFSCGTAYGVTYKNDISVNYPSTDAAYHPYSNICPISGWDNAEVKFCRKNLFDINYLSATGITISGDGEVSGTAENFYKAFNKNVGGVKGLKFKPNTKYILSFKAYTDGNGSTSGDGIYFGFHYTDGSNQTVSISNNQTTYAEFYKESNTNKTIKFLQISYSSRYDNIWHIKDVQLEENTRQTAYEPYNGIKIDIPLGNTVYGGEIIIDNSEAKLRVTDKLYTFDGTESWYNYQDSTWYTLAITDALHSDVVSPICTNYTGKPGSYGSYIVSYFPDMTCAFQYSDTYKRFYVKDSNLTINNIQESTRGMVVCYKFVDPIEIPLADINPFTTVNGIHNIFADSGNTEVVFKKSIDDAIAELQALILS